MSQIKEIKNNLIAVMPDVIINVILTFRPFMFESYRTLKILELTENK